MEKAKSKKMTFNFKPSKEIRDFDCGDLIGKTVNIHLGHISEDKKRQYLYVDLKAPLNSIGDWVQATGKEKGILSKKIKCAYLMERCNGGRSDHGHYTSYKDYFNKAKKEEVIKFWRGGLLSRIGRGGGDLDECDLILEFEGFKIEGHIYDMVAPEEWYSEMHRDSFKFERGFYKDAEEAIHFFSDRPNNDLFGERYFPVIVFPKNTKVDVLSIAYWAKSHSKPIVTAKHIVIGLRCKPGEYAGIFKETYEKGGWVARSMEWNWD